ncbi:MAG: hypothetical protein U5K71_11245 [Gracilimonas sp.]|nr:hypothetical protein [Gracilimonas sp.]
MRLDQKDFLLSASNYNIQKAIEESVGLQVGANAIVFNPPTATVI